MTVDDPTLTIARLCRVLECNTAAGLTLPQYRVLGLLAGGDERASLLASRVSVAKPTLTSIVDSLFERGFVTREIPDGDRRSIRLSITDSGRSQLQKRGSMSFAACSTRYSPNVPIPGPCSMHSPRWATRWTSAGCSVWPRRNWSHPKLAADESTQRQAPTASRCCIHPPRSGRTGDRLATASRAVHPPLPRGSHRDADPVGGRPDLDRPASPDPTSHRRSQHPRPSSIRSGRCSSSWSRPACSGSRPTTAVATSAPRSASASSTTCDWRSIGISTSSTSRGTTSCRSAT